MAKRAFSFAVILVLAAACGGSDSGSSAPALPSSVPPPTITPTPLPDGFRLSGTVVESTSQGSRPTPGGGVFFWIGSRFGGRVAVGPDGRFEITELMRAPIIRLTWTPGPELVGLHQPCPISVAMPAADVERNIEVVRFGDGGYRFESPTVSGRVYETTASGPRPLPHTRVLYSLDASAGYDAYSETDDEGRYVLCRIPRGSGRLGAGDCNDAVFWLPIDVNGDKVIDVDLRPFKQTCPS
jgi:hypothetical protein